MNKKVISISSDEIRKVATIWVNYLVKNPQKLFRPAGAFKNHHDCLSTIEEASGFQITAFAGKAQNDYTNPARLPDFGELNLLARLRAIQALTKKPLQIVLDGEYYCEEFGEDKAVIVKYEQELIKMADLVDINKEFPTNTKTFYTVNEFLSKLNLDKNRLSQIIRNYEKMPEEAFEDTEIYPKELIYSILRILPTKVRAQHKKNLNEKVLDIAKEFIIKKAALSKILKESKKKNNFQRITILKYVGGAYPRLNLEILPPPWNSTILFKNNFKNINTAINGPFEELALDERNFKIVDESNRFWGFSRNVNIFQSVS